MFASLYTDSQGRKTLISRNKHRFPSEKRSYLEGKNLPKIEEIIFL